jgi:ATP-binding cassette subfamily B protein
MWNRQREAEAAREKLALVGEAEVVPDREPPSAAGLGDMPLGEAPIVDAAE